MILTVPVQWKVYELRSASSTILQLLPPTSVHISSDTLNLLGIMIFRIKTPCSFICRHQDFGAACCLRFQGREGCRMTARRFLRNIRVNQQTTPENSKPRGPHIWHRLLLMQDLRLHTRPKRVRRLLTSVHFDLYVYSDRQQDG